MKIICIQSPTFDYLTATLIQGLQQLGHTIIASENSNYANKTSTNQIKSAIETADLVIAFSNKDVNYSLLAKSDNPNQIFVDGSDTQEFIVPNFIRFKAIFKREINRYWINKFEEPIFPLPFAAEDRYFNSGKTKQNLDVTYVANMHTAFRQSVYECLKSKNLNNAYIGTAVDLNPSKHKIKGMPIENYTYRDILYRSKISVNVIGGGYDCARYWEILAAGSLLLTQKLDILIPNPFEDGKNCCTFQSLEELTDKLDFLLSSPSRITEIQEAGFSHLIKHHTTKARAEYFLKKYSEISANQFCFSFYDSSLRKNKSFFHKFLQ
jgi:hypothetical protein